MQDLKVGYRNISCPLGFFLSFSETLKGKVVKLGIQWHTWMTVWFL